MQLYRWDTATSWPRENKKKNYNTVFEISSHYDTNINVRYRNYRSEITDVRKTGINLTRMPQSVQEKRKKTTPKKTPSYTRHYNGNRSRQPRTVLADLNRENVTRASFSRAFPSLKWNEGIRAENSFVSTFEAHPSPRHPKMYFLPTIRTLV